VELNHEITASTLNIQSGFLRWHIPIAAIERVYPTRNPLSSPVLSLNRLQVDYRKGGKIGAILISPKNKAAFMQNLVANEAGLKMSEGQVVRG